MRDPEIFYNSQLSCLKSSIVDNLETSWRDNQYPPSDLYKF